MIRQLAIRKNLVKLPMAILFWLVFFSTFHVHPAKAFVTLNPAPPPNSIPGNLKAILNGCDTKGFSPSLVQWMAPAGNASATSLQVTYNTNSIPFRFHYAGAVCYNTSVVSSYQLRVYGIVVSAGNPTSGVVGSGLIGTKAPLTFNPYNVKGTYDRDNNDPNLQFDLTTGAPGGFAAGTYNITLQYRGINTRVPTTPDQYDCTVPVGYQDPVTGKTYKDAGSPVGFGNCPLITARVHIDVTIEPNTAPNLSVSNPKCNGKVSPTGFTVNSTDADSPTANASYVINYTLQTLSPGGWINVQMPVNSVKQFGSRGPPRNFTFTTLTINGTFIHRVVVRTFGYGIPRTSTPTDPVISAEWGPCVIGAAPDHPPVITTHPSCNLFGPGIPGFTVGSIDVDGSNYDVRWNVRNAPADITIVKSGVMPGPWPGVPIDHRYKMTTMPGYDRTKSYKIHASSYGLTLPGQDKIGLQTALVTTLPPCPRSSDFTIKVNVYPPTLLPDDQNPTTANFHVTMRSSLVPIANIPNTREFYIKRGGVRLIPNFATRRAPLINIRPGSSVSCYTGSSAPNNPKDICNSFSSPVFPAVLPGDEVCEMFSSPSGGSVDTNGRATFEAVIHTENCATVSISNYFSVYGGDVFAGSDDGRPDDGTPATNCAGWGTDNTSAGIFAFKGRTGGVPVVNKGSAAEAGVFALGKVDGGSGIYGFSSARLRAPGPTGPPIGLTFANVGPTSPGGSGIKHCPFDFYGNRSPGAGAARLTGGFININNQNGPLYANANNNYSVQTTTASAIRVRAPGGVPNGEVINVYVNGSIYIQDDIAYKGAGGWGGLNDIPRVQIVVRGNIYIGPNVTQLDGIYVAQPNGSTNSGTIYTCSTIPPPRINVKAIDSGLLYNRCSKQLTINGSLVASRVKWLRTYGSLNDGTTTERPTNPPTQTCHSVGPVVRTPTCASEVINFTPEAYLVASPPASNVNTSFDSFTSLPPLL